MEGRVHKLVPCENCSTEYVYVMERESVGYGISFYWLNEAGAEGKANSTAAESLKTALENDFDPIPCPVWWGTSGGATPSRLLFAGVGS